MAQAEIVSTDQLTAQRGAHAQRAKILAFLDRAGTTDKLLALGMDGPVAKDRIANFRDQEVPALTAKIDSFPAGGNVGDFSDEQLLIVLLLLTLVAIVAVCAGRCVAHSDFGARRTLADIHS